MRRTNVRTYTVSITGAGTLAPRFEQMLDVLPAAAMEGGEGHGAATLWFDVRARNADAAIERAYLRTHRLLSDASDVTFAIVPSRAVEGRRPWWRRALRTA
jgi:hypothetical protein